MGPSASGKTKLAIDLAVSFCGEIISADSRQLYSRMDIATAKPSFEERGGISHHLFDIKNPDEEYSVAEFASEAASIIQELSVKNKIPIVVGGTGLYFRILLENFAPPKVAPNKELRDELELKTTEELYKELRDFDPVIAEKIHFNNKVKIIRALEVCKTLNKPMSEAQGVKESDYDVLWIGLNAQNRQFLYDRADLRVDKMMEDGLLEEFKSLFDDYGKLSIFDSTIGYQELLPYIENQCTLDDAVSQIKQNTRRYVKRQLSWFRANKSINWLYIDEQSNLDILDTAKNLVSKFLESGSNL